MSAHTRETIEMLSAANLPLIIAKLVAETTERRNRVFASAVAEGKDGRERVIADADNIEMMKLVGTLACVTTTQVRSCPPRKRITFDKGVFFLWIDTE